MIASYESGLEINPQLWGSHYCGIELKIGRINYVRGLKNQVKFHIHHFGGQAMGCNINLFGPTFFLTIVFSANRGRTAHKIAVRIVTRSTCSVQIPFGDFFDTLPSGFFYGYKK